MICNKMHHEEGRLAHSASRIFFIRVFVGENRLQSDAGEGNALRRGCFNNRG